MLLEVRRCGAEGCSNKDLQFKKTPLIIEEVHDVEGVRTRASCFDGWDKGIVPLGMKRRPALEGCASAGERQTDGKHHWMLMVMVTGLPVSIVMKRSGRLWAA